MTKFIQFRDKVSQQIKVMNKQGKLFTTSIGKDLLWDIYINSFPEGTNEIYRERTEHDCLCCKHFIKTVGNVVVIVDNKMFSIWDIKIGGKYQVVADTLSKAVKSEPINNRFFHYESVVGSKNDFEDNGEYNPMKYTHFYTKLPNKIIKLTGNISIF